MKIEGTFSVSVQSEPPFDVVEGVSFARSTVRKEFSGMLTGTSTVHMLGVRTPQPQAAGYVAIERIVGQISGKSGSFATLHQGTMEGSELRLTIPLVPGSGTGELTGIRGHMVIRIEQGQHHYELHYELPGTSP